MRLWDHHQPWEETWFPLCETTPWPGYGTPDNCENAGVSANTTSRVYSDTNRDDSRRASGASGAYVMSSATSENIEHVFPLSGLLLAVSAFLRVPQFLNCSRSHSFMQLTPFSRLDAMI
jgi:hypothetical protein